MLLLVVIISLNKSAKGATKLHMYNNKLN